MYKPTCLKVVNGEIIREPYYASYNTKHIVIKLSIVTLVKTIIINTPGTYMYQYITVSGLDNTCRPI